MKRKLLMLVCAICIMMSGMVTNAENTEAGTANGKFTLLEIMGIFENTEDTSALTRGMLAEAAAKMMNMGDEEIGDEEIPFKDVHPLSANAASVMVVYRMGIMTGENGEFRPSENASLHEVVKVMACVAGYGEYAASRGGYPAGYIEAAHTAGILKGGSLSASDTISVKDASALVYNTLHADFMRQLSFGSSSEYKAEKDYTVLKHYFDISTVKGLVEANEYTAVYSEDVKSKRGCIIIGGAEYKTGESNAAEYLGCWTETYVQYNELNDEYTVVAITVPESKNNIKTIDADEIDSVIRGQYITCTKNDKTERIKINATTNIVYNGKFYNKAHNTENDILMPESGSLTLYDSDYDDVYDIIMVEAFEYIIAEGVNKQEEIIIDKYGANHIKAGKDYGERTEVYRSGRLSSYDTVKSGELLEIKRSADKMLVYINIPGTVVSGAVTAESEETLEIDGTEYKKLDTIIGDGFTVGTSGDFYLNSKGEIAAVKTEIRQKGYEYGLLIDAKLAEIGGAAEMKIFTQNNEMCIYEAEEKIVYNETAGTSTEEVINRLTEADGLKRLLVSYKLNGNGKINSLTVIDKATNPEEAEKYYAGGTSFRYKYTGTFGMAQAAVTDECVFFSVPPEDADDESYSVWTRSELTNDKYYAAFVYDTDDYLIPGVILIYDTSVSVEANSNILLIEKIKPTIVNDETVMKIVGGNSSSVTDAYWYEQGDSNIPEMSPGDIVQINATADNKIRNVRILKNAATKYTYGIAEGTSSLLYYAYGKVVRIDTSKGICVINTGTDEVPDLRVCVLSGTKGYKYNKETEKVTVVSSAAEISLNQEIYVRERYQEPKEFVVFE